MNAADRGERRPSVASLVFATMFALVNAMLGYMIAEVKAPESSAYFVGYAIGYVLSAVVFWQAIAIALFWAGKRFRNPRSAVKIYTWTSVVVLFGLMTQIGAMLPK